MSLTKCELNVVFSGDGVIMALVIRRLIQEGDNRTKDNLATLRKGLDCLPNGKLTDGNLLPRSELYFSFRREA